MIYFAIITEIFIRCLKQWCHDNGVCYSPQTFTIEQHLKTQTHIAIQVFELVPLDIIT